MANTHGLVRRLSRNSLPGLDDMLGVAGYGPGTYTRQYEYINDTELSSHEETLSEFNPGQAVIKRGIDVHRDFYVMVVQEGGGNPKPTQRSKKDPGHRRGAQKHRGRGPPARRRSLAMNWPHLPHSQPCLTTYIGVRPRGERT
jgi:hypothetical protein